MKRRHFIQKTSMGALALSGLGAPAFSFKQKGKGVPLDRMFVGTMIIPAAIYEAGIPESLDAMQELAGINTVMPFSHTHVGRQYRKDYAPFTDQEGNALTDVYYKTNPKYYSDPRFQGKDFEAKYADRDLLKELVEECEPRGMQVYARILEPYVITGAIPGFEAFAEINVHGEESGNVCYNHPGYIAYWESVMNDLIISNPKLAGFKFGQERGGPLFEALGGNLNMMTCFCSHCKKKAKERGLDMEEARKGLLALKEYSDNARKGNKPRDGFFATFMRILSEYPDVLAFERFMKDSREDQRRRMYKQIKGIREDVQVGWHIDHSMGWSLGMKAFWEYEDMVPHSDWLSIALYFDSLGRRSLGHYRQNYKNLLFGDADPSVSYPMYLSIMGLDPETEPPLEAHKKEDTEMSDEYVYRESKRAVEAVNGRAKVYGRIGFDMPGYECDIQPQQVYKGTTSMFEAGVDGVFCGREWDELQPKNAEAFGNALRDHLKKS